MLTAYAQEPEQPPTDQHTFTVDKSKLEGICDSIAKYTTGGEQATYNAYFAAVKESEDYATAQTYLDEGWPEAVTVTNPGEDNQDPTDTELEEMEAEYQDMVDALVLPLTKAYKKAPFDYVATNVPIWYNNYYGNVNGGSGGDYTAEEWTALYDESDYASILTQATEVLATYNGREDEIPDDMIWLEKEIVEDGGEPGTGESEEEVIDGIIPLAEDLLSGQSTSYENKVLELRNLLLRIAEDETGAYATLKTSAWPSTA